MPHKAISRRRFLSLIAITSTLPILAARKTSARSHSWRGTLMGTKAQLTFYGADETAAIEITRKCLAEVRRLENIFSLYQPQSQICALNQSGTLKAPSHDMRQLLSICQQLHRSTKGKFDPSVQPLWALNRDWFSKNPHTDGPPAALIHSKKALIGFDKIHIGSSGIELGEDQAITLNGIAQGYITDRISELLRRAGWSNILVNMGEYYAIGQRPSGSPFKVQLANSDQTIPLANHALASSSNAGFVFPSSTGRQTHLIDPQTAQSPDIWQNVHVSHPQATICDGLSTAFSAMNAEEIKACLVHFPNASLWVQNKAGGISHSSV